MQPEWSVDFGCGHDPNEYVVAALVFMPVPVREENGSEGVSDDAPVGGWIYCPEPGCHQHRTWSFQTPGVDRDAIVAEILPWEEFAARMAL